MARSNGDECDSWSESSSCDKPSLWDESLIDYALFQISEIRNRPMASRSTGQAETRRAPQTDGKSGQTKRLRDSNWTDDEMLSSLPLKLACLTRTDITSMPVESWSNCSHEQLSEKYGSEHFSEKCGSECQIEASKCHWSELALENYDSDRSSRWSFQTTSDEEKENIEIDDEHIFQGLKEKFGGFFFDWGDKLVVGDKIAEGGQAEIYAAHFTESVDTKSEWALMVFKKGHLLRDLEILWPSGLFKYIRGGLAYENETSCEIIGATLLKNGRLAFLMHSYESELRKLIDLSMQNKHNEWPPFSDSEVGCIDNQRSLILDGSTKYNTSENQYQYQPLALQVLGSQISNECPTSLWSLKDPDKLFLNRCKRSRPTTSSLKETWKSLEDDDVGDIVKFVSPKGLIHADGIDDHRRQIDTDINVTSESSDPCSRRPLNTKLKGETAALQAMGFNNLGMSESVLEVELSDKLLDDESARMRIQTRNWNSEEIRAVLELREEALRVDVGPDTWDYVSENLLEKYGFDRASTSCHQKWDTLLQSYRAIQDHESKIQSGTSSWVSYWKMSEDERSKKKLKRIFELEWFEMIETMLAAKSFEGETRTIHMDSKIDEIDTPSEDEGWSSDSTAALGSQVQVTTYSHVSRTSQSHEPCYDTNSDDVGRKGSSATVMEDDLISRIAPFVNKQIEDALKPLFSILRSREEDEQKILEEMLAIEKEKLALKREKYHSNSVLNTCNAFQASDFPHSEHV